MYLALIAVADEKRDYEQQDFSSDSKASYCGDWIKAGMSRGRRKFFFGTGLVFTSQVLK